MCSAWGVRAGADPQAAAAQEAVRCRTNGVTWAGRGWRGDAAGATASPLIRL